MRCLSNSNYLVKVVSRCNRTPRFKVHNKLVYLDLSMSDVYCINSIVYKLNRTNKPIRLPSSVLVLNITSSCVFRPPNGFFVCMLASKRNYSKSVKFRESLIRISHFNVCVYFPKSIRHT